MRSRGPVEIALLVAVLAAAARLVDGPTLWLATALVVACAVAGTLHVLGEWHPRRIRYDRLALPAIAAFAAVGLNRLLEPSAWLLVSAPLTWLAVAWVVNLETDLPPLFGRAEGRADTRPEPDAVTVRTVALGLAFLAFVGTGGILPGALAGGPVVLSGAGMVAVVLIDAAVGGLVGLRIAVFRGLRGRRALVEANFVLALAGHAGGLLRAIEMPRLLGPALLTAALYVWLELRASPVPLRERPLIVRDGAAVAIAGVSLVALGLLIR